jgi:hypothetical protein
MADDGRSDDKRPGELKIAHLELNNNQSLTKILIIILLLNFTEG